MKSAKPSPTGFRQICVLLASLLATSAYPALTDLSQAPLPTYSPTSSTDVKPNILFVLDDSGSMDWDFMPDWATLSNVQEDYRVSNYTSVPNYLRYASGFNGLAYNAAIRYQPPAFFDTNGTQNTTRYPSMTGQSTTTGGDSSASAASRNWKAVPNDGFGVQSTSTSNLVNNAWFYTLQAGEYCNSSALRNCQTTATASGTYAFPAPLRWCTSSDLTTCKATWDSGYTYPRAPAPRTATITISTGTSTSVSGITVDGLQILSGTTTSSNNSITLADSIVSKINSCTKSQTGNCTTVGYSAYRVSDYEVTILAPGVTTATPAVTKGNSGTMTFTANSFDRRLIPLSPWLSGTNQSSAAVPGENLRTTITSTVSSYPKANTRTDCTTNVNSCTYTEEMTNYANWWAYYRTRMQMMKSSASRAFAGLDSADDVSHDVSRFRVGYMSINNNNNDFINLDEFKTSQKNAWYTKLFAANPDNSTPLRVALSTAGRLYGGKLNGTTLNGTVVTDPLQFSCQQNYTILSTDGFWNSGAGFKLDGSTAVGNQDESLPRPYNDGGSVQMQKRTSDLQQRTTQQTAEMGVLQSSTSTLQSSTSTLQSSTSTLQSSTSSLLTSTLTLYKETSNNSGGTWTAPSAVSSCTWKTSGGTSRTRCSYSPTWSTPTAGACTPVAQGTNTSNNQTWNTAVACSYSAWSTPVNGACTPAPQSTGTGAWTATARQCSYTAWSTPATTTSCTPAAQSTGTGAWSATARQCSYTNWTTPANAASCTPVAQSTGTGAWNTATARQCSYTPWTTPTNAASCTPVAQSTGTGAWNTATAKQCQYSWQTAAGTPTCSPAYVANNYTNPTVYRNCSPSAGNWANVTSCTATARDSSGQGTECQYTAWSNWADQTSCTAIAQSTGPDYTVSQAVDCQTNELSAGTSDTLADVAAYYYNTDLRRPSSDNPPTTDVTGTCDGPTIPPATTPNNLCTNNVPTFGLDVSSNQHMTTFTLGLGAQGKMVYSDYQNDASGNRTYVPNYWDQVTGDFYDVKSGTTPNAANGICSWMASGKCTWPTPASNSSANIDDLWHAAVNGRGKYFSAGDPTSLTSSLAATLEQISLVPRPGTAAAAASSNPNISTSDNYVFSSSYRSVDWTGELIRQQISESGVLSSQQWSAMQLLDCANTPWLANHAYLVGDAFNQGGHCYKVTSAFTSGSTFDATSTDIAQITPECSSWSAWTANTAYVAGDTFQSGGACYRVTTAFTSGSTFSGSANISAVQIAPITRTIYTRGSSGLTSFTWSLLSPSQQAYFTKPNIAYTTPTAGLSQFCASGATCLSTTAQDNSTVLTNGAAGEALVNFLRGDRSNEGSFYRKRMHVLGDIVSSEARYVKAPLFNYDDAGYADYKALRASRSGTVYVAANDGMLHAFDATTGQENWAFIPSAVLPNIYKLADINYASKHQFLVDGSPEIGEICPTAPDTECTASQWRTILVGGLNAGGKAYYALDITDPVSPTLLWEFTDANLGYSFSNPRITKLKTGQWVVMFASGYNNSNGVDNTAGDGQGRLFIVNAFTGATAITGTPSISTGVGSFASPSGLSKISAHAPLAMTDNTVQAVYGGDTLGNLWRFDVNGDIGATGREALRLVSFTDGSNNPQPITSKPVVTTVNNKPVIYVGTGRYLGVGDVSSTQIESFYAVKDNLTATSLLNPRTTGSGFVEQDVTSGTCPADAPSNVCTSGQSVRTTTNREVDWSTDNGWYFDFVNGGERSTTDSSLGLGVLMFTTIRPNVSADGPCGIESTDTSSSYVYAVDYLTGGAISGSYGVIGASLGLGLATRPVMISQSDGSVRALIRMSGGTGSGGTDGGRTVVYTPNIPPQVGSSRRVSWRELNGE